MGTCQDCGAPAQYSRCKPCYAKMKKREEQGQGNPCVAPPAPRAKPEDDPKEKYWNDKFSADKMRESRDIRGKCLMYALTFSQHVAIQSRATPPTEKDIMALAEAFEKFVREAKPI